jgi:SAM-dependent methyltransferase
MDSLSPSLVLAAYAEPLLDARRVALFGDATSPLAAELIERGSRAVHVYDPEPSRVAEAAGLNRARQISIVPLDEVDVAVRDGAFDVAIVEDLSTFADAGELLKQVRRALGPRGVAIIASPNFDAKLTLLPRATSASSVSKLSYYDLYDAVSTEFSEVRMLGQTPFVGYAVVDFTPGNDAEVALDSGLVPGGAEEPEWFVAVASHRAVELDAISVVQLPSPSLVGGRADAKVADDLRAARVNEARLTDRIAELDRENAELRERHRLTDAPGLAGRVASLETTLAERDSRIGELEARLVTTDRRAAGAGEELDRLRKGAEEGERLRKKTEELERLRKKVAEDFDAAKGELATRRTENQALESRLSARDSEAQALVGRVAARDAEIQAFGSKVSALEAELRTARERSVEESPAELTELETGLKERGERIRKLETDLREAERIGRELVREVAGFRERAAKSGSAEKKPALPDSAPLLLENARLRADLEAASWSVTELEERLAVAARSPGTLTGAPHDLASG